MSHKPFPSSIKVLAIIQLCITFAVIIWSVSIPFVAERYALKAKLNLYKTITGDPAIASSAEGAAKLERNKARFAALPQETQQAINEEFETYMRGSTSSAWSKVKDAIEIFLLKLPPFTRAWIALSLIVSLMILLGIPSARQAVWLLPLITIFFAYFSLTKPDLSTFDETLYPSENEIVRLYLQEPLKPSVSEQREQLLKGWRIYLIKKWAHQEPAEDPAEQALQVEEGEFAFNIHLLKGAKIDRGLNYQLYYYNKESIFTLMAYILWNLIFALSVWLKKPPRVQPEPQ